MGDGEKKQYRPPVLREISADEVIQRLLDELDGALGETPEQRSQNAVRLINGVLRRLPVEERGEAIRRVIAASPGWLR